MWRVQVGRWFLLCEACVVRVWAHFILEAAHYKNNIMFCSVWKLWAIFSFLMIITAQTGFNNVFCIWLCSTGHWCQCVRSPVEWIWKSAPVLNSDAVGTFFCFVLYFGFLFIFWSKPAKLCCRARLSHSWQTLSFTNKMCLVNQSPQIIPQYRF